MPKVQIEATELVNPSVGFVSMVKRGANRIPFRITKGDTEDMIDLTQAARTLFQKSAPTISPTVIGVAVTKSADLAPIQAALKESGIDVSTFVKTEDDTAVTLTKADSSAKDGEVLVMKAGEDVAIMVHAPAEFVKSMTTYDWESTSFKEVMQKGTFAPTVCMAQDMLQRTFFNIMEKAENPKDLAKMLKGAVGEFEEYVVALAKGLPETVFKADTAIVKAMGEAKKSKAKDETCDEDDTEKAKNVTKEEISGNPVHGNETKPLMPSGADNNIEGSAVAGNETPTNPGTKPNTGTQAASNSLEGAPAAGGTNSSFAKGDDAAGSDILTAMQKLLEANNEALMKSVNATVEGVRAEVSGLSKSVEQVQAQVKKTDEALGGVVLGNPAGEASRVTKTDTSNGEPPLLDTAFMKVDGMANSGRRAA